MGASEAEGVRHWCDPPRNGVPGASEASPRGASEALPRRFRGASEAARSLRARRSWRPGALGPGCSWTRGAVPRGRLLERLMPTPESPSETRASSGPSVRAAREATRIRLPKALSQAQINEGATRGSDEPGGDARGAHEPRGRVRGSAEPGSGVRDSDEPGGGVRGQASHSFEISSITVAPSSRTIRSWPERADSSRSGSSSSGVSSSGATGGGSYAGADAGADMPWP